MATRVIVRRRDGLVQIRPRRPTDLLLAPDVLLLLTLVALLFGFLVGASALAATLVAAPVLSGVTGGLALVGAVGVWLARPHPHAAHPGRPPPRRVA